VAVSTAASSTATKVGERTMPLGIPPILGAGVGLPGTPQEDVIRQAQKQQVKDDRKAASQQMKKSEREAMAQGLEYDPTASAYSETYHNMENYGFGPPPEQAEYYGFPERQIGVNQLGKPINLPGVQPIEFDPASGRRNEPSNFWDIPYKSVPWWSPEGLDDPRHLEKVENYDRYQRDEENRGTYVPPPIPGQPPGFPRLRVPLPATRVFSPKIPPPPPRPL